MKKHPDQKSAGGPSLGSRKAELKQALMDVAVQRHRQDGSIYQAIDLHQASSLSEDFGISLYLLEDRAMESGILPQRYSRNQQSLSITQQLLLHRSHIAIIGLGGLGGTVMEILARIGVGKFTLVDGDHFDESNLNRQLLAIQENLDQEKAAVAGQRVLAINPAAMVSDYSLWFTRDNGGALLENCSLAMDCLDSIRARFILEECCMRAELPLVSAAIGGSMGQVTVIKPGDPGLQLIYGKAKPDEDKGVEKTLGTLAYGVSAIASIQASEAVKLLLSDKPTLHGRLLIYDLTDHHLEIIELGVGKEDA
jgi:molybdopterin/thiamine biosynthesis adenylyltransferase